ncbi:hypothetical protein D3C71_1504080 [compost metagenome]
MVHQNLAEDVGSIHVERSTQWVVGDRSAGEAGRLNDTSTVQERHTTLSEVRVAVGVLDVHQLLGLHQDAEHSWGYQSDELVQRTAEVSQD